ncbi:MAG: amino acid ABC transporter permease [Rhodospirillales bacterium]|nr:amino acid ABC transporter permease [Rhodospirillales bacterium]
MLVGGTGIGYFVWNEWNNLSIANIVTAILLIGLVGLGLALLRLSPRRFLSWPAGFVIEVFRTTPPLVQLFWFFFALPMLVGIEMTPFVAGAVTFSIQSAAFFAEVFRAGIQSIERGQWDAARAIGMRHDQALHRIILPQAVKRMIPAFMERAIELMKTTTLIATISYADLLFAANEISQKTFRPLETYTVVAVIYFVVIFLASQIARLVELRLARSGESTVH